MWALDNRTDPTQYKAQVIRNGRKGTIHPSQDKIVAEGNKTRSGLDST